MHELSFSKVVNGDVSLHVASVGQGPLVVFCHGFPGLWYSWRAQMEAVAAAGYRAVALDMRGYGESSAPQAAEDYSLSKIRADLLAVLAHFAEDQAVFVGTDFGAAVVWNMALVEPARVRKLVVLAVPYDHDYYGYSGMQGEGASAIPPSQRFAEIAKSSFLHAHYFQEVGRAEKELNSQPQEFLTRLFWALSAKGDLLGSFARSTADMGYIEALGPAGEAIPWSWMTEADMGYYVSNFQRSGFTGALNWYRVCDENWRAKRDYIGEKIEQACLFIAGEKDPVLTMSSSSALDYMQRMVPNLQGMQIIQDAGHFVHLEQPELVNAAITEFLGKA